MRLCFSYSLNLLLRILLVVPPAGAGANDAAATANDQTAPLFQRSCVECHDADSAKGGLNIEKLDPGMAGPEQVDLWTKIYDRVARGQMPPAKKSALRPRRSMRSSRRFVRV